ncbi:hypothetical protein QBC43DRAFT_312643 [Cladorrhinum sp. PSN259]|nr:hypothetical protein QBC43DRAFT_312643 [Cladorrhinum sp. PSN259]
MASLMDSVKTQGLAKMKELADSIELTPDMIKSMVEEIGGSPEKLRAMLNLWFVPRFKPAFAPDRNRMVAALGDVEFLGLTRPAQMPTPRRMFDIDTGNLVDDWPAIGAHGQYCMLSHRWKGEEIKLGDIKEARRKDEERAKAGITPNGGSDLEVILQQCEIDIQDQAKVIEELYSISLSSEESSSPAPFNLGDLLGRRLDSSGAEFGFGSAKRQHDEARTKVKFAEMERRIFTDLITQVSQQVEEKMQGLQPTLGLEKTSIDGGSDENGSVDDGSFQAAQSRLNHPTSAATEDDAANKVVDESKEAAVKAEKKLGDARARFNAAQKDIEYFHNHPRLRDALDDMVLRLERWKSAIKVKNSIWQAHEIFDNKLFQHREKRYLWTDTCCIDKTNFGELSESLSLMGDWYADAEFTLVQLDTPYSRADSLKDWRRFEAETGTSQQSLEKPAANIPSFDGILGTDPEWSGRAWTLQELVMSKTTYYVNSDWRPLSRPVESLGCFYYLIPFIELYTRGDTENMYRVTDSDTTKDLHQGYWGKKNFGRIIQDHSTTTDLDGISFLEHVEGAQAGSPELLAVSSAHEMIILLDALGVRIPKDMVIETATSEMAQAVYIAAADLCRHDGSNNKGYKLLTDFIEILDEDDTCREVSTGVAVSEEEQAQHAINFILQCLVAETKDLVRKDREYIAKFSQVEQLEAWQNGTARTGFSAQSVLEVSGKRWATVETDRAYALMGILGVRFTTFPAEGYPKALSRLLDEVIIAHNDVSVFNWTGMDMGSPIRGRSMYPAAHTAFGNQEDRGRRYNLMLSNEVQEKMDDVMKTYHGVINVLQKAIEIVRDKKRKNLPLSWVEHIIKLLQYSTFQILQPELEPVSKIVRYITHHCVEDASPAATPKPEVASDQKASSLFSLPTMSRTSTMTTVADSLSSISSPSVASLTSSLSSLPSPSVSSFTSWGSSSTNSEKDKPISESPAKKGSRFGLSKGLGIKTPSFGASKKSTEAVPQTPPPPPETPPSAQSPAPIESPSVSTPIPPTEKPKPTWVDIDKEVTAYLQAQENDRPKTRGELPEQVRSIKLDPASHEAVSGASTADVNPGDEHDTISPNPIIVNNSGIEGLFDVQRVIVTMIDTDKLRRQVSKAVSPRQRISGWCSISTGFARVVTGFSCEKRILERQLDVIQTVEAMVLREHGKGEGDKRSAKILGTLKLTKRMAHEGVNQAANVVTGTAGTSDEKSADKNANEDEPLDAATTAQAANVDGTNDTGNTEEERLVSRMIEFIQEPSLKLVAGEWVLARFSGTPGANWFLCHLELGANPSLFYGHRIATGDIDFRNSTPEPGLVGAWQEYMNRKKRKMCYILAEYLASRKFGKDGEERRAAGADLAKQAMNTSRKTVEDYKPGLPGLPRLSSWSKEGGGAQSDEKGGSKDGDGDGGSDDEEDNVFEKVFTQGKLAALAFRDYTVLAMVEKLFEMHAGHLDKTLSTRVLKRTPKALRSAVENMSDNRSLMPAMFHSSTRVHMF